MLYKWSCHATVVTPRRLNAKQIVMENKVLISVLIPCCLLAYDDAVDIGRCFTHGNYLLLLHAI